MKSVYIRKKTHTLAGMLFMVLFASTPASGAIETLEATVTVDISEPTCSVSAPQTVNLGMLTPGKVITWLPDVSISVDCSGQPIKHALYMTSQNTLFGQQDGIFLKRGSDNTDTGIVLQLKGADSNKFTTDEQNPEAVSSGTGSATYPIKVRVEVPKDAKTGEVVGTVVFKLHYS
ncbi:type 1 fimbrial protein [Salmonella enterica]|nr:type 1 fimbrial protein [Salmonella enterica subsp. enterica]EKY7109927.1 type 1 fimbrial protein [Salmonella enterica]